MVVQQGENGYRYEILKARINTASPPKVLVKWKVEDVTPYPKERLGSGLTRLI